MSTLKTPKIGCMKPHDFGGYPFAKKLAVGCAKAADRFPKYEQFALAQQLRRAAYSVVLNIAEGFNRKGTPSLCHYLDIAYTSANEVEVILELSGELNYMEEETLLELRDLQQNAARLLFGYKRSIAVKSSREHIPRRHRSA